MRKGTCRRGVSQADANTSPVLTTRLAVITPLVSSNNPSHQHLESNNEIIPSEKFLREQGMGVVPLTFAANGDSEEVDTLMMVRQGRGVEHPQGDQHEIDEVATVSVEETTGEILTDGFDEHSSAGYASTLPPPYSSQCGEM